MILPITIVTGVPGTGKARVAASVVALTKDTARWVLLRQDFAENHGDFSVTQLQEQLAAVVTAAVASRRDDSPRSSTSTSTSSAVDDHGSAAVGDSAVGGMQDADFGGGSSAGGEGDESSGADGPAARILVITTGFVDIVDVVRGIFHHPDATVRASVYVASVCCCIDPTNCFADELRPFPTLLEQAAEGWCNVVVLTGTRARTPSLIETLIRTCVSTLYPSRMSQHPQL